MRKKLMLVLGIVILMLCVQANMVASTTLEFINQDTTLTVRNNPNAGEFGSIASALIYLENKVIRTSSTVTISLVSGVYTEGTAIDFVHPQGSNIHIDGNSSTVHFNDNQDGIVVSKGNSLGQITNITLSGGGDLGTYGLKAETGGSIIATGSVTVESFGMGFYAGDNGSIYANYTTSRNNFQDGYVAQGSGMIRAEYALSTSNGRYGVWSKSATIVFNKGISEYNGSHGLRSEFTGMLEADHGKTRYNTGYGIVVERQGYVEAKYCSVYGNTAGSYRGTSANVLSPDGSFIWK